MILGLFFTRNVSLETWVESGLIDREKTIYEDHLRNGYLEKVYWFTYGVNDDKYYHDLVQSGRLDSRIMVISPPKLFAKRVWRHCYWWILPFMYRKIYKELDVVKSNQRSGALDAWFVGKMYRVPFYFRTGYTESSIYPVLHEGKKDRQYKRIRKKEAFLYKKCDIAAVSSEHDKDYVCKEYGISRNKVKLVRNFIDTDKFQKKVQVQNRCDKIVYIGRLMPPKNLFCMIQAVAQIGVPLDVYGNGKQRKELEKLAQDLKADVNFKGTVANSEIPDILNQCRYYILASIYEGMPKTLLEAMACGCLCIGTPTTGIAEIIEDGVNGFLAKGMESEDIAEAIRRAHMSEEQDKISGNACDLIKSHYSLAEIAKIDKENISAVCKNNVGRVTE